MSLRLGDSIREYLEEIADSMERYANSAGLRGTCWNAQIARTSYGWDANTSIFLIQIQANTSTITSGVAEKAGTGSRQPFHRLASIGPDMH